MAESFDSDERMAIADDTGGESTGFHTRDEYLDDIEDDASGPEEETSEFEGFDDTDEDGEYVDDVEEDGAESDDIEGNVDDSNDESDQPACKKLKISSMFSCYLIWLLSYANLISILFWSSRPCLNGSSSGP